MPTKLPVAETASVPRSRPDWPKLVIVRPRTCGLRGRRDLELEPDAVRTDPRAVDPRVLGAVDGPGQRAVDVHCRR